MKRVLISILLLPALILACRHKDVKGSKDVDPENIFFDYQVLGQEADDMVVVKLQFKVYGPDGSSVFLTAPSHVEFDGKIVNADTSKLIGAFYQVELPFHNFAGKHSIVFIDINKKEYREDFEYDPVSLKTPIVDTVRRGDLLFEMGGMNHDDMVRIVMTDTTFRSEGINRIDSIRDGRVMISKKDLERLVDGPVELELMKDEEKHLQNSTREGGILLISYNLKRNFTLKN